MQEAGAWVRFNNVMQLSGIIWWWWGGGATFWLAWSVVTWHNSVQEQRCNIFCTIMSCSFLASLWRVGGATFWPAWSVVPGFRAVNWPTTSAQSSGWIHKQICACREPRACTVLRIWLCNARHAQTSKVLLWNRLFVSLDIHAYGWMCVLGGRRCVPIQYVRHAMTKYKT